MDWESLYCPNRGCRYYGRPFLQGHLVKNGSSHGALVPFDGGPPRAIFLDVTAVASHAPPQSNILVLRGRL